LKQLPKNMKYYPPVQVVSQIMQKNKNDKSKIIESYEEKINKNDEVLAALALEVFSFGKTLERYNERLKTIGLKNLITELGMARNNLYKEFEKAGVKIIDLKGREVDEELLELVEIIGWLKDEREMEHVLETYEPLITRGEKILHLAKVTGGTRNIDNPGTAE
jgi:molecular chaperone GrpE (heat shock protein)